MQTPHVSEMLVISLSAASQSALDVHLYTLYVQLYTFDRLRAVCRHEEAQLVSMACALAMAAPIVSPSLLLDNSSNDIEPICLTWRRENERPRT